MHGNGLGLLHLVHKHGDFCQAVIEIDQCLLAEDGIALVIMHHPMQKGIV
ncbi:hypothetical protein SDC9_103810 [bioreactor metagenome]|uniref:Uncharacterized protein n=1 Tax=bioreactor metagenome TaxID=1076179 RepID=A0A645B1F1_9ZZZZ